MCVWGGVNDIQSVMWAVTSLPQSMGCGGGLRHTQQQVQSQQPREEAAGFWAAPGLGQDRDRPPRGPAWKPPAGLALVGRAPGAPADVGSFRPADPGRASGGCCPQNHVPGGVPGASSRWPHLCSQVTSSEGGAWAPEVWTSKQEVASCEPSQNPHKTNTAANRDNQPR